MRFVAVRIPNLRKEKGLPSLHGHVTNSRVMITTIPRSLTWNPEALDTEYVKQIQPLTMREPKPLVSEFKTLVDLHDEFILLSLGTVIVGSKSKSWTVGFQNLIDALGT